MQSTGKKNEKPNSTKTVNQLSCGAIVYTEGNGKIKVLLMEQNNEHYKRTGDEAKKHIIDIGPSGHIEEGEAERHTASREIHEETGLDILQFDAGFRADMKYEFDYPDDKTGKPVHAVKTRRYWCAKISPEDAKRIRISDEHKRFWFEPIESAIKMHELEDSKRRLLKEFYAYKSGIKPRR